MGVFIVKKLFITSAIVVVMVSSGSLLLKNDAIANSQPVVASVDWVLEQLAPYSERLTNLESEIDRLESEVEALKKTVRKSE